MPTVSESDPREAYDALRHGADLAIATEPPPARLASAALAVLPVWAYVRADHAWHDRDSVRLEDLATETVLALTPAFKPRQILDRAMERAGVSPGTVVDCSNPQVAQALAAAGRGVAVVSDDPRFGLHPLEIVGAGRPVADRAVRGVGTRPSRGGDARRAGSSAAGVLRRSLRCGRRADRLIRSCGHPQGFPQHDDWASSASYVRSWEMQEDGFLVRPVHSADPQLCRMHRCVFVCDMVPLGPSPGAPLRF